MHRSRCNNAERIYRVATYILLCSPAIALWGCDGKKPGPKREDHEVAHKAYYHPDVDRSKSPPPVATRSQSEPEPEPDVDLTSPDIPRGRHALFVNSEAIIIADVLEPIMEDLRVKVEELSTSEYIEYAQREVLRQVQQRLAHVVILREAKRRFEEERFERIFAREAEEALLRLIRSRYGGARAAYEKHLAEFDMTYDEALERAKEQSMVYTYLRQRFELVRKQPTRRDIVNYYDSHRDEFTSTPSAVPALIEIHFKDQDGRLIDDRASDATRSKAKAAARARAEQILREIRGGASFEDMAKEHSDGIRASEGGVWEELQPNSMVKRWALACEELFRLRQGQVSGLVETPVSYFIVKAVMMKPAHTKTFEQAQAEIVRKLQEEQFDEWSRTYIMERVEEAGIPRDDKIAFASECLKNCPIPLAVRGGN